MHNLDRALEEYTHLIDVFLKNPFEANFTTTPKLIEEALSEIAVASGLPDIRLDWKKNQIEIRKKVSGTPWATINRV